MSLPVTVTITGMESLDVLHQNLASRRDFSPCRSRRCRRFATA